MARVITLTFDMALFPLVFSLVPLVASCASPERYQDAVVSQVDGSACFGIADQPEARVFPVRVVAVKLYERVDGRAEEVWQADFTGAVPPEKRLSVGECISYPDSGSPEPLLPGRAYSVEIWSFLDREEGLEQRWYTGYFCMIERDGQLLVHQVQGDDRRELWAWEACGPGVRW